MTEQTQQLEAPLGLRPAQLGIILLARPVLSHAAATLVDLTESGVLRIEGSSVDDWVIARGPSDGRVNRGRDLAEYESALIDHLCSRSTERRWHELQDDIPSALRHFRFDLIQDAVHNGWLRRLNHDERTTEGESLVKEIRRFRLALSKISTAGPLESWVRWLPYAVMFGMVRDSQVPSYRFATGCVHFAADLKEWKRPEQSVDYEPDTWSHNQWGGMPPGTAGGSGIR